jgi:DNA-binding PadR family transcriptional regulator
MNQISSLEFALIGLLQQRPQSGYDLRKTFATTAMRHYSDSPGSIYPALRRLEARGWIAAQDPTQPADSRRRRVFRLTTAGKEALVARISLPVTREDVIWQGPELMLRFAFMDGNVPRATALRFLEDFERELGSYVEELRGQLEQMRASFPIHTGVLAFQSGIEGMEAQLDWARRARALLGEAGAAPPMQC